MNCKDCTHYEACNYWLEKEKKHLNCEEGFICEHFKDKFECIQLPSFEVYHYCPEFSEILPYFINDVCIGFVANRDEWAAPSFNAVCARKLYIFDEFSFELEDIGKTVFLTYEDAEKALKEDCNENN